MDVLSKHRGGLNAIARALLDNEIIDGREVSRLVDEAHGSPVHTEGAKAVPHFEETSLVDNGHTNGSLDHSPEPATVGSNPGAMPPVTAWPPPPWPPGGASSGADPSEGPTTP
jgi:hypothetical protein